MHRLLAATALAATLAAPLSGPVMAADPAPPPAASAQTAQTPVQGASNWVTVASVDNLVGRTLRDPQGHDAGEIYSAVVDLQSGTVPYVLVESNGSFQLDGKYVAVPFSELKLARKDGVMNVGVPADKLLKAKRFSEDQLGDLAKPQEVATLTSFYAVPKPAGTVAVTPATANETYVLVRHDSVMRMNVGKHVAGDVRGETVVGTDGKEVGEIDKIMVDTATGHIAYLLLNQGGFLGIGENWVPVPAQAVSWDAKTSNFTMKASTADAKQQATLSKTAVPVQVRRSQLKALYERFGLKPYWQA